MPKGLSRWRWLTLFAACNLACWLGVAAVIVLVVSDSVDLGVETSIRKVQATVVAAWDQSDARSPKAIVLRTQVSSPQIPTTGAASPEPTATSYWFATATPPSSSSAVQTPTTVGAKTTSPPLLEMATAPLSAAVATPTFPAPMPTPPGSEATLASVETLIQSPLLLADPGFQDLTRMNDEMRRSAVGRAVQIRFQETALNQAIAALLEGNDQVPYQDVYVELKRDQVSVSGTATVLGFPVNAQIVGTLQAVDCLPQIEVQYISVEGVVTPSFVKDQIEGMLQDTMAWYPADYPLCLQQIVVEEGRATIYGSRR
jgi:hypothetical protein